MQVNNPMLKNCCWQNWLQQSKHQDVDAQSPFSIITFGDIQRSCPSYPINTMGILKSNISKVVKTSTKILGETCKGKTRPKLQDLGEVYIWTHHSSTSPENKMIEWFLGVIIKSCLQDLDKNSSSKMSETTHKTLYRNWFPFQSSKTSLFPSSKLPKVMFSPSEHHPLIFSRTCLIPLWFSCMLSIFLCQIVWWCQKSKPAFPKKHLNHLQSILPPAPQWTDEYHGLGRTHFVAAKSPFDLKTNDQSWEDVENHHQSPWFDVESKRKVSDGFHKINIRQLESCSVGCG